MTNKNKKKKRFGKAKNERKYTHKDGWKGIIAWYRSRLKIRGGDTFAEELDTLDMRHREYALAQLVSRYEKVVQNDLLHQVTQTDEIEDLHWSMTQPAWMQAHVANTGHYDNFLRDVGRAWSVAEKAAAFRPEMIGRQVRYALLQTSINSLASNMLPEMLMAGLQTGRWSAEAALAYAQQVTHSITKVTMLTQVGAFLRQQHEDELAYKALTSALAGLRDLDSTTDYVKALLALVPHLPPDMLADALAAAQEIAASEDRARVLCALAPYLSTDLLYEALEIVWEIGDSKDQAAALAGLAPRIPPNLFDWALEMVRRAYWPNAQAKALVALAPHLPPELIPQAREIAEAINDPCYRVAALMAFPQHGQANERLEMMRQALKDAKDAFDVRDSSEEIVLLAPYLPSELLPEAVTIARTIGGAAERTRALVVLAPDLPSNLQVEVIAEVRTWSLFVFNDSADVLAALAPYLPQDLMPAALVVAREIIQKAYGGDERVHYRRVVADQVPAALVTLAPYLPSNLMPEALAAVSEIPVGNARSYALTALAPYLPKELIPKALQIARQIEEPEFAVYHAMALAVLSQYGAHSAFDEAFTLAQQGQYADDSIVILPLLLADGASMFPPKERTQFLNEALKAAREIHNPRYRSEAFTEIAKYFPESRQAVLDEAKGAGDEVQEPLDHLKALLRLLPSFPIEQRRQVVSQVPKLVQMTFEKHNTSGEESAFVEEESAFVKDQLLSVLGPLLSSQQPNEMLNTTQPELPSDRFQSVVEMLKIFEENEGFAEVAQLVAEVAKRAPLLSSEQRRVVLAKAFEAAQKADELSHDFGSSLAKLAPYVPSDLYSSALALARKIRSPHALAALVPYVPDEERQGVLDEALTIVGIRSTGEKVNIPTTLVPYLLPYLPPHQQLEALRTALAELEQIPFPANWEYFRQTLWSIAEAWAQLPYQQAYALWGSTLHEYAAYRRQHFLAVLSVLLPVIQALGSTAAVIETMNAVLEVCRRWPWSLSRPQPST